MPRSPDFGDSYVHDNNDDDNGRANCFTPLHMHAGYNKDMPLYALIGAGVPDYATCSDYKVTCMHVT